MKERMFLLFLLAFHMKTSDIIHLSKTASAIQTGYKCMPYLTALPATT